MPKPWSPSAAEAAIESLSKLDGPLLPMLHALQREFGFLPPEATEYLAEKTNLSIAEVHGVISFYHDFRTQAPARLIVKVCQAEACQAAGVRAATAELLAQLGASLGEPTRDGSVAVEPVYCLGLCAVAPAAMIGDRLLAGFDGASLCAAVEAER